MEIIPLSLDYYFFLCIKDNHQQQKCFAPILKHELPPRYRVGYADPSKTCHSAFLVITFTRYLQAAIGVWTIEQSKARKAAT